jgi:hypothetical protein
MAEMSVNRDSTFLPKCEYFFLIHHLKNWGSPCNVAQSYNIFHVCTVLKRKKGSIWVNTVIHLESSYSALWTRVKFHMHSTLKISIVLNLHIYEIDFCYIFIVTLKYLTSCGNKEG